MSKKPTNKQTTTLDCQAAMIKLLEREPYYLELVSQFDIIASTQVPVAAIGIKDGKIQLLINPTNWAQIDTDTQSGILEHECDHILSDHISRAKELFDKSELDLINSQEFQLFNIAADLSINQRILSDFMPDILKIGENEFKPVTYNNFITEHADLLKSLNIQQLDRHKSSEFYYEIVKNFLQQQNKNSNGNSSCSKCNPKNNDPTDKATEPTESTEYTEPSNSSCDCNKNFDDHSKWFSGEQDQEKIKQTIRNAVNIAKENSSKYEVYRRAGNLPAHIEERIEKLNKHTVDWRSELSRFSAQIEKGEKTCTRKRRNRRYNLLHPGTKTSFRKKIAVLVDTSGSVTSEELKTAFSEIHGMWKCGTHIEIIQFSATLGNCYTYEGELHADVADRGGTIFSIGFDKAAESEFDGIICITDGGDFNSLTKAPNVPLLWLLFSEEQRSVLPYDFGDVVVVKE